MSVRGQLRIIGGRWRSRRLRVAAAPGLRPSADAVRETLFNWLPHDLRGKVCLDLFAGSGALGFEAASRGAVRVVMVESNRVAAAQLRANCDRLHAHDTVEIVERSAHAFLQRDTAHKFDLVFIDPPFAFDTDAIQSACHELQQRAMLNSDARIYIESPHRSARDPLPIPADWHIIRNTRRGRVQATLLATTPLAPKSATIDATNEAAQ